MEPFNEDLYRRLHGVDCMNVVALKYFQNSCYIDTTILALFFQPTRYIWNGILTKVFNNKEDETRVSVSVQNNKFAYEQCNVKEIQEELRRITLSLHGILDPKVCNVTTLRTFFDRCQLKGYEKFGQKQQQDSIELIEYLFQIFGLHLADSTTNSVRYPVFKEEYLIKLLEKPLKTPAEIIGDNPESTFIKKSSLNQLFIDPLFEYYGKSNFMQRSIDGKEWSVFNEREVNNKIEYYSEKNKYFIDNSYKDLPLLFVNLNVDRIKSLPSFNPEEHIVVNVKGSSRKIKYMLSSVHIRFGQNDKGHYVLLYSCGKNKDGSPFWYYYNDKSKNIKNRVDIKPLGAYESGVLGQSNNDGSQLMKSARLLIYTPIADPHPHLRPDHSTRLSKSKLITLKPMCATIENLSKSSPENKSEYIGQLNDIIQTANLELPFLSSNASQVQISEACARVSAEIDNKISEIGSTPHVDLYSNPNESIKSIKFEELPQPVKEVGKPSIPSNTQAWVKSCEVEYIDLGPVTTGTATTTTTTTTIGSQMKNKFSEQEEKTSEKLEEKASEVAATAEIYKETVKIANASLPAEERVSKKKLPYFYVDEDGDVHFISSEDPGPLPDPSDSTLDDDLFVTANSDEDETSYETARSQFDDSLSIKDPKRSKFKSLLKNLGDSIIKGGSTTSSSVQQAVSDIRSYFNDLGKPGSPSFWEAFTNSLPRTYGKVLGNLKNKRFSLKFTRPQNIDSHKIKDYGLISEIGGTRTSTGVQSGISPRSTGKVLEIVEPLPKNIAYSASPKSKQFTPLYTFLNNMPVATVIMVLSGDSGLQGLYLKVGRKQTDNKWVRLNNLRSEEPDYSVQNEIWYRNIGKFIIPLLDIDLN